MISVIVVFPKLEEARSIKNLLVRSGIEVMAACTTAAQVINLADDLDYGIVVSGYKFVDMMYSELREYLPDTFDMLLVVSKQYYSECGISGVVCLSMPVRAADLIENVRLMYDRQHERMKRERTKPKVRTAEEKQLISRAKTVLMEKKKLTEEEAHRYLQKKSMDNGTNLVETAHMILDIF
ncbi:MAG: ANTAR domain-containing protein [Bacteroidales bacterium]|nr:ANTAR domain-containing protein [Clostridium sp.]MCM1204796.1 ANTAR domain-containing protein [Bacteroidales bacterium]